MPVPISVLHRLIVEDRTEAVPFSADVCVGSKNAPISDALTLSRMLVRRGAARVSRIEISVFIVVRVSRTTHMRYTRTGTGTKTGPAPGTTHRGVLLASGVQLPGYYGGLKMPKILFSAMFSITPNAPSRDVQSVASAHALTNLFPPRFRGLREALTFILLAHDL